MGVALILADKARQPGGFGWIDRLMGFGQEPAGGGIDNRLAAPPKNDLDEDNFIISPPTRIEEDFEPTEGYFAGVNPRWFDVIRDNSIYSVTDRDCSLALLNILKNSNEQEICESSEGRTTYAQLFRQPSHYRGRLVTVAGDVHQVVPQTPAKNKYGIERYYEVWLYPTDNSRLPIVIYCLDIPEGFPVGTNMSEKVEATGFFFKRWAYCVKDTWWVAPTIIAKTMHWEKRPVVVEESSPEGRTIAWIAVAAALSALLTAWVVYLKTRTALPQAADRPPDFERMKELDQGNETNDEI